MVIYKTLRRNGDILNTASTSSYTIIEITNNIQIKWMQIIQRINKPFHTYLDKFINNIINFLAVISKSIKPDCWTFLLIIRGNPYSSS